MLVIPENGYYRAVIQMEYAKVEFTGKTRSEAIKKAEEWMEIHYVC